MVPILIDLLEDEHIQVEAMKALAKVGKPAVQPLVKVMEDRDFTSRALVTSILAELGPVATDAVQALTSALTDPVLREGAAHALTRIAPSDPAPLLSLAAHRDRSARLLAVRCLGKLELDTKQVLPALVLALKDQSSKVRRAALLSIASYATHAQAATRAIARALDDRDQGIGLQASIALRKVGRSALGELFQTMPSLGDEGRENAILVFRSLIKESVPWLVEKLDEKVPPGQRLWAVYILGKLGPAAEAKDALRKLYEIRSHPRTDNASRRLLDAVDSAIKRIRGEK